MSSTLCIKDCRVWTKSYTSPSKPKTRAKAETLRIEELVLLDIIILALLFGLLSLKELIDLNSVDHGTAEP